MRSLFLALVLLAIGTRAHDSGLLRRRTVTTTTVTATTTAGTTGSTPSPTQSGIACNCKTFYKVLPGDTCDKIVTAYNSTLTTTNFYAWNSAVGGTCTNLWVGYYVCIAIDTAATTACAPSSTITPALSTSAAPSQSTSLFMSSMPMSSASYSIIQVTSPTVSNSTSTAATWPPNPTQSGIALNCNRYYQVRGGDTCDIIRAKYATSISLTDLHTMNPALGSNCTSLFVNWWICVGLPWNISTANFPSATSQYSPGWTPPTLPPVNTTIAAPSPTQSGLVSNCQGFYAAQQGDNCSSIASSLGYLTVPQLILWNPALASDCSGLTVGNYYCVENTTTSRGPPTVTGSPSPVQSGIVNSCTRFYLALPGATCDRIVDLFGSFSRTDFFAWNPALNSSCSGVIPGDYYCVGVSGTPTTRTSPYSPTLWSTGMSSTGSVSATPSTRSPSSPTLSPTSSTLSPITTGSMAVVATPTPIQSGVVAGCKRFYYVESGDGCYAVAQAAGVALTDFYAWNPSVKSDCSSLQVHVYVCIGIAGAPVTITSGTPIPATPSPVQTSMVSNCVRFYKPESGDGCYSIAQQAGIALSDFYSWNPAVGSSCAGLQLGVFVCIGLHGSATTIASGTPVPALSTSTM